MLSILSDEKQQPFVAQSETPEALYYINKNTHTNIQSMAKKKLWTARQLSKASQPYKSLKRKSKFKGDQINTHTHTQKNQHSWFAKVFY